MSRLAPETLPAVVVLFDGVAPTSGAGALDKSIVEGLSPARVKVGTE